MRILCLGDSITDCGHLWDRAPLGDGYVQMMAERADVPGYDMTFKNCGFDGFTVERLLRYVRDNDCAKSADVVTILIGINDVGLMMNTRRTEFEKQKMMREFYRNYAQLITVLSADKRAPQIILTEPFIFPYPEEFKHWIPLVNKMSSGIKELAEQKRLPYLRLQDLFNHTAEASGWSTLTIDGIHLTAAGHQLLADSLFSLLAEKA